MVANLGSWRGREPNEDWMGHVSSVPVPSLQTSLESRVAENYRYTRFLEPRNAQPLDALG